MNISWNPFPGFWHTRLPLWFHIILSVTFMSLLPIGSTAAFQMQGGNYIVSSIFTPSDSAPQVENDLIKGITDSVLIPVFSPYTLSLRPGQLIMRKKQPADQYAFYTGNLDTAGFNNSQPVFVFSHPHWARLSDMLSYRFYRAPTEAIGTDEPVLYFDDQRIYTRSASQLYYFHNGIWFSLIGSARKPFGSLSIASIPSGARVIINGFASSYVTPCNINNLIAGKYTVELQLSHYQFFRKTVSVFKDSVTNASFELISDVDTIFITGSTTYSLLLLPEPPVDLPYTIDDSLSLFNSRIRISAGIHRIQWTGDERFLKLDTLVDIPEGKVVYFDYLFKRKYGIVRIIPSPVDAEICIDRFGCSTGERIEELPVGLYRIDAFRSGFGGTYKNIRIYPDTVITCAIDLSQVSDRDGDGYIDSCDGCPDTYGLYNGCPTPQLKSAVKSLVGELTSFISTDNLTIGISLLGIVSKSAINRDFRNFLSVFSSGKSGGINNYKGITALNSIECSYKGLYGSIELGQWSAGLQYQRDDTLFLDSNYCFVYDSLRGIEPVIYLPSTSFSFGFHYRRSWLNISYSLGYQWEDIVINQILDNAANHFEQVTFNNDWWYHQLSLDVDFNNDDFYIPSFYFRMKYPFGTIRQTRWTVFNTGFQLKITARKKKDE